MSVDLENKFRAKGLDDEDEPRVRKLIMESRNTGQLISYIYIYGRSFKENKEVLGKCDQFISNQIPGLTAVCMRVLIDFWNKYEAYYVVMDKFLDLTLFDIWYDEVIFTVSFIKRNRTQIEFPRTLLDKFDKLASDDHAKSLDIL